MNKLTLILFLTVSPLLSYAQGLGKGMYFDNLNGSSWISSDTNDSILLNTNRIGLSLWNRPIDSLKHSATIWIFDDSLTIKSYNALTKKDSTILTCAYKEDIDRRRITFTLNDTNKSKAIFDHVSVSTGTYVGLWKPKEKKNKRKSNH